MSGTIYLDPGSSNRCFLVATGALKPVRVPEQLSLACWRVLVLHLEIPGGTPSIKQTSKGVGQAIHHGTRWSTPSASWLVRPTTKLGTFPRST